MASEVDRAKGLLEAGLQALIDAREGVRARRGRVFDVLLGRDSDVDAAPARTGSEHDFESVFDERVARALARLGYPPPDALNALVGATMDTPPRKGKSARRRAAVARR